MDMMLLRITTLLMGGMAITTVLVKRIGTGMMNVEEMIGDPL
jgi:hypothetical protein